MTNSILPLTETLVPADPSGVVAAVGDALRAGAPIYPIGGGTSLDYGVWPTQPGLGVSLEKLNRVVDHPARDLTITVEAGVTTAALAECLAAERQRLPVDIPQAGRATIGGVVAGSPSGPWRYRWGTMRDYVIGIRAVDGCGKEFAGGGRVVKNAAGYDLCRMMTGSLGTLGVITQVTLMVRPMPDTSAIVTCGLSDFDSAERLLSGLVQTDTLPSAIEVLVGPAWRDDPALASSDSTVGRLVVEFEGTEAEVQWMTERLGSQWASSAASPVVIPAAETERLRKRMTEFPVATPSPDGSAPLVVKPLVVKIAALPSATVRMIRALLEVDPECSIQAHAGNGVIRARFDPPPEAMAAMVAEKLRPMAADAGGRLTVLSHPVGAEMDSRCVWGPPGDGADVMQAIKDRFDPKGLLNPGRFVYASK